MIDNRKFNPKKLYKLIKILVIIITVLSWCLVLINNIESSKYGELTDGCNRLYAVDYSFRDKCMENLNSANLLQQNNSFTFSIIGILLPLFFFGGTWIFRYIFPVAEKKKD